MLRIRDLGVNVIPIQVTCQKTVPGCAPRSAKPGPGCGKSKPPSPKKYEGGYLDDDAVAQLRQQLNDVLVN